MPSRGWPPLAVRPAPRRKRTRPPAAIRPICGPSPEDGVGATRRRCRRLLLPAREPLRQFLLGARLITQEIADEELVERRTNDLGNPELVAAGVPGRHDIGRDA